ncbi:MAG: hypothetical protein H8E30_08055 [Alphaproteobacteria bacterium]|nr:hypothetical protein [Alphaproteobacteria bacterium]
MKTALTTTIALLCTLASFLPELHAAEEDEIALVKLRPDVRVAINNGLRFIESQQHDDGRFSTGGARNTHETSVALMAFMLQGHIPGQGKYGLAMESGLSYLIAKGEEQDGFLGSGTNHAAMYEHGLAVLALSEAWGQSKNPKLRKVLRDAVDVTLRAQNDKGGWRYTPKPEGADLSMTAMHLVALNSARESGIAVPQASIDRAVKYVISCQGQESGGFTYIPAGGRLEGVFPVSAAGTLALILSGKRDDHSVRRGITYLKDYDDSKFSEGGVKFPFYAHYYAIQCMYQSGEEDFKDWYPKILKTLLETQNDDGSWKSGFGGVYGTGMAILISGVPYRYLPIYQR